MKNHDTYAGIAALSICEALRLALNDAKVLPENEIIGVLKDATSAHEGAVGNRSADDQTHIEVAKLISQIIADGNSVRRAN